jgi:hypothetical protein
MTQSLAKAILYAVAFLLATSNLQAAGRHISQPFFAQAVLQDVTFQVESANEGSINRVTLRARTAEKDLGSIEVEADGTVTNVETADLDANGYPEIYIYVNSAGSGSYGSLIAYASNRNLSLSDIYLPPLENDPDAASGYMGHDDFVVGEGALLRRFPVYLEGDVNAKPSGGTRQVQYHLEAGEAGWLLVPYKVINF